MDWRAILIFGGIFIAAGLLLYLPFFIWFRWRRRKTKSSAAKSFRYTAVGWCFMGFMLAVLFGGLAMGQIAPTSWFGSQVRTLFGGLGYMFTVWLIFSAIEWGFRRMGIPFAHLPSIIHDDESSPETPSSS